MRALIAMAIALGLLVALLRNKVKIGISMIASALALAVLLNVTPYRLWQQIVLEWQNKPISQTTGYLFISLTALLLLVNVIGAVMKETGISQRLILAMHGLFRSRRIAISVIPLIMGMLPTPGGIMLSAPMVRELGDNIGISRSRQATINFFFRHLWEPVWPLFPAVLLARGIFGCSALSLMAHNGVIPVFGALGGGVFLLLFGFNRKKKGKLPENRGIHHDLRDFLHAFWPIAFTAILYVGWNIPPAVGIFLSIMGLFLIHKLPVRRYRAMFAAGNEPDLALLIFAALLFKLNLEAAGAVEQVMGFLSGSNVPYYLIIFFLPFIIAFLTGITTATVTITFPLLTVFIGTGSSVRMGLEVLAFSGVLCGLYLTPVHLCLPLSAGYFDTPLSKIIAKIILPVLFIAAAGIFMALFFS